VLLRYDYVEDQSLLHDRLTASRRASALSVSQSPAACRSTRYRFQLNKANIRQSGNVLLGDSGEWLRPCGFNRSEPRHH
jgi:hypothetical protein